MATLRYETKDVLPIVLIALNYLSCDLTTSIFKIALDNQFADLKGLVDPEEMDQAMNDMTEKLDDPLSVVLRTFSQQLMDCYSRLAIVHNYDLEELFIDDRLTDLATDIYTARSFYTQGLGDSNLVNLDVYLYSIPLVIDQLIALINTEEFDEEELKNWFDLDVYYFEQFQDSDVPAIRELGGLGISTYNYHGQVSNIIHHSKPFTKLN
jgi:hypothetical protein